MSVAKILETMKDKIADAEAEAEPNGGENMKVAEAPTRGTEPDAGDQTDGSVLRSKRLKVDKGENTKPAESAELQETEPVAESKGASSADQRSAEEPGMTVEEYEAMLDAEAADWDFPDGM